MARSLLFITLASLVMTSMAGWSNYTQTKWWYGGGCFTLDLNFEATVSSWTATITFDRAVKNFDCWCSILVSKGSDGKSFVVKNESYNGAQSSGASTYIGFSVDASSGSGAPVVTSVAINDGASSSSGSTATTEAASGTTAEPTEEPEEVTFTEGSDVPSSTGDYDYNEALYLSILFYEAQRSGDLPADQRVTWRKDSALSDLIPGGYYDAGDFVKFGFPMATSITQLAWGAVTFADGYRGANQVGYMYDCLKWGTDYFIAAHTATNEFYGQIGDGYADHSYWGRPEDMTMSRPAYKIDASNPGSDLAGETAAALAASAIFFRDVADDEAYATKCLKHAKELFAFANNKRGKYSDSISNAAAFYCSSGFGDELTWAAAWLYKATGEETYLTTAKSLASEFGIASSRPSRFDWDNKVAGAQILLYEATKDSQFLTAIKAFVDTILYSGSYTPKGLLFIDQWGPCRHAANVAHAFEQIAALGVRVSDCQTFSQKQIGYMLGDTGFSYLIGFGSNYPKNPHHRSSSCPDAPATCNWDTYNNYTPNAHVLKGALVGGPSSSDNYSDTLHDYISNEVTTDYNAGFQSAVAALASRN